MCWFRYVRNYVFFKAVILAIKNAPSFWPKKASFGSINTTLSNFVKECHVILKKRIFSMLVLPGHSSILVRSPLQYRSVLSFMQHSFWNEHVLRLSSWEVQICHSQEKKTTLLEDKLLLKSFKSAVTPMVLTVERWDLLDELLEHGKTMK